MYCPTVLLLLLHYVWNAEYMISGWLLRRNTNRNSFR